MEKQRKDIDGILADTQQIQSARTPKAPFRSPKPPFFPPRPPRRGLHCVVVDGVLPLELERSVPRCARAAGRRSRRAPTRSTAATGPPTTWCIAMPKTR
eukprot:3101113-Rhodomonas_salina.1